MTDFQAKAPALYGSRHGASLPFDREKVTIVCIPKIELVPDLAGDDVAEHFPRLAVELHQLHLFDREEVCVLCTL